MKWVARYREADGSKTLRRNLYELHPCTEKELEKFHPPEKRSIGSVDRLKKGGGLFCLDWENLDLDIYGVSGDGRFSNIGFLAVPCHVKETSLGGTVNKDQSQCVEKDQE